jgi:5,10-methylenetetrahydrofolate reductase
LRLRDKLRRNVFTTIIEVFPPNFSADETKEPLIGLSQKTRDLIAKVKMIENLADAILVADVKDLGRLKLSSLFAAALLKSEIGVEAIPVITARDMNRAAIKTMILTSLAYDLDSIMLVWGDKYNSDDDSKNVYDYQTLSGTLADARALSIRADRNLTLLAPIGITSLEAERGQEMAMSRLSKGADCLLAQPPTSDVHYTFPKHLDTLAKCELTSRIMLNVFPFRNKEDLDACRTRFGWELPDELDKIAKEGEARLLKECRILVDKMIEKKLPGVYVSTRGKPELARFILA